ncbi:helix-turn-helix transcriptional regulator [Streptomyces sp. Act143]|uniref:helix-turn-helix transcriptional regulator n=1 Tax=Streptomyces sp. Act143 TaxID=2200760 RepID=UPI000D680AEE|nr:LuxR C-terminal-related transcriptional regulator [Streptomyces sp. Act143]PWI13180.1 helix-turn-helix transcriptional regulator [Streptomyces sp. Act143]
MGEEADVDRLLREAGGPRCLLVLGETGSGRTRLLRIAARKAAADGARVLAAGACPSEARQSYACLHQLLLPVQDACVALAEPERRALRALFTPSARDGLPRDRELSTAVLALLTHLARTGPVLLAVDDLQDCDRDSWAVLSFVTRRLTDPAVTALFTACGDAPPPGLPAGIPVRRLRPLTPTAAARLLDAQPGAPTGRARLELLRQAAGNPLAIIELSRAAERPGFVPHRITAVLDALPDDTRRALLYAATAEPQEELALVMAALGTHDLGVWAPAEAAGVITVTDGRLSFRSALLRVAALQRQPAKMRQRAYRDLAARSAHHAGDLPVRSAHHTKDLTVRSAHHAGYLAAAAVGPDESVAAALEEASGRGDRFTAARALERAARLSPLAPDRARRLTAALTAASDLGDPVWVRDLYAALARTLPGAEVSAAAACALSGALSLQSYQREAFDLLLRAAHHTPADDAPALFALAAVATGIARQSGLPEHAREAGRMVGVHADDGPRPTDVLVSLATRAAAVPGLSRAEHLLTAATLAHRTDDSDLCAEHYRRASELLRAGGALGPLARTLPDQVDALLGLGRWTEAEALIEEGLAHAAVHHWTRIELDLQALRSTLRALRGESGPDTVSTAPHPQAFSLYENRATHARMLRACGLTALALGDAEGAFRHLRTLFTDDGDPLDPFLSPRCIAELAVAAQRTGKQRETAHVLARVRRGQGDRPTTRMTLLMHHAAALVDEDADPEHHFQLAVVNPEAARWPLERARARLDHAIWLRRQRRQLEARAQLTDVLETAVRLGARQLAESARGELRASGVAEAPPTESPLAELTAQQRQIVRLAAKGLSNREIGEQLFLSPRTVGSHLYNVYPKLGVSSRHQLRDLLVCEK